MQHTDTVTPPAPARAGRRSVVVAGNGMVGERFLAELARTGLLDHIDLAVIGEEHLPAYDRVHLSAYVEGATADELSMADPAIRARPNVTELLGRRVDAIDRDARTVTLDDGRSLGYDDLVLATGSRPFVPPIPGHDLPGCHVYRTIADLDGITADATHASRGVVIGGGLLGLEAANALRLLGLEVTVIEFAPRLMPRQLDQPASDALRARVEALGLTVRTDTATAAFRPGDDGRVARLEFTDGSVLDTDMVVFSAGIRARDELARAAGLDVGERGGVAVGPTLTSSDPHVHAIGECASVDGVVHGLVGPGYTMARVLAERLGGGDVTFRGADPSTQLKLLGVDVASFGDAMADTDGARVVVWDDPVGHVHRKLVVSADGTTLLGGILVGDASGYDRLLRLTLSGRPVDVPLAVLAAPTMEDAGTTAGELHDDDLVCTCNTVTKGQLCTAIRGDGDRPGLHTMPELAAATNAGTGCGSCTALCKRILDTEMAAAGLEVDTALCAHFPQTRQELYEIVRVAGFRTFAEVLAHSGTGTGCATCKPTIASILATITNEYVLDPSHAPLQDTNDRFLANIQKDGTYSVIPRVPGGEITPDKLMVIAGVAKEFDLYTKITGGQRIDLLGARLEQLPSIWRRLVDAGFESGHAYGKALRTVKSCVGRTWCRYGVQDSTTLAIELEERYRGLRSPHKIKMAVSGCSRECAEARGKDVGVIATENGWNLYVCGNGGMTPQHAVLLATDLSTADLVRTIDRFLAYYVRTADRLERTATWLNRIDGGIAHVRAVVVDDSLGLAEELESHMAHHVATYACEWKATLEDPARLAMFASYVDGDGPDTDLAWVRERDQRRPATAEERRLLPVVDLVGAQAVAHRTLDEGAIR
ncbi:nitrite reductase large subunit NirB [Euzebya rosea]|uniref:nitrite reductase large subunit NirB n=1 Tax=Euzebya rosea TaxID=2052804 RepID=UPI000D3E7223|nr:nitrite reductase large subunit NirB [Euzebya rosea]